MPGSPDDPHDEPINITPASNKARIIKLIYSTRQHEYTRDEIHHITQIPKSTLTTTLETLLQTGHIGKTNNGHYHPIETRDDLWRFASGLNQLNRMFEHYDDEDWVVTPTELKNGEFLTLEDAEQTIDEGFDVDAWAEHAVEEDIDSEECDTTSTLDKEPKEGFDADAWAEHARDETDEEYGDE